MNTKAVVRALQHFRDNRWDEIRTLDELDSVTARFVDDKEANTAFAQHPWGYKLWNRAHQVLEQLVRSRTSGGSSKRLPRRGDRLNDRHRDARRRFAEVCDSFTVPGPRPPT